MTWKQIEELERPLRWLMFKDMTKKQIKLWHELSCRGMINSCLIYWSKFFWRYDYDYINKLWETRVRELYEEQLEDFKKAEVKHCVYTDSEWCTYNSIKRADE